ncbi:MAG: hypothetical protein JSU77_06780 [Fidelibacterota bacterium]|nr:MAG: hypothetical protein JSU77_06780 [Candidatus Neomarinimicrobiota bacterium]
MSVDYPSTYSHEVDIVSHEVDIVDIPTIKVGSVGPVTVNPVTINGIPDTYHIDIDIKNLPKIELGIDPIEVKPVDLNLRLKEIPSIRGHVPADFCVSFSLLGLELGKLRLCGEAQVITEPYRPNPCEICGEPAAIRTFESTRSIDALLRLKEG